MTQKKTEKTDSTAAKKPAENSTKKADQPENIIIDVTPEKASSGKGLSYFALLLATVGLGLGGFSAYTLMERGELGAMPTYPSELDAQYTTMLEGYQQMADAEFEALQEQINRLESLTDELMREDSSSVDINLKSNGMLEGQLFELQAKLVSLESALAEIKAGASAKPSSDLSLEEAENLLQKLHYQRAADALIAARKQSKTHMREVLNDVSALAMENLELRNQVAAFTPEINALYTKKNVMNDFARAADEALAIRIEGEGWWQQQVNKVAKLVKVRKVNADSDSITAKIEAAQTALAKGNVQSAITNIQSLPSPASDYFAAWLPKARAYHMAQKSYDALVQTLRNAHAEPTLETTSTPDNIVIETPTVTIQYDVAPELESETFPSLPNIDEE